MTADNEIYSRIIHYDEVKDMQARVGINLFREVEYLFVRKYYRDFDAQWKPSNEGVNMPLDLNNSKELFAALLEILSLAESKETIIEHFKDLIQDTYQ